MIRTGTLGGFLDPPNTPRPCRGRCCSPTNEPTLLRTTSFAFITVTHKTALVTPKKDKSLVSFTEFSLPIKQAYFQKTNNNFKPKSTVVKKTKPRMIARYLKQQQQQQNNGEDFNQLRAQFIYPQGITAP